MFKIASAMLQFTTTILDTGNGIDAAYIETPIEADIEAIFGQKRPKVRATFDGKVVYRGLLTRMKTACHLLILRKDIRQELGKRVGDTVSVLLELDTEPRRVEVPQELQAFLDRNTDLFDIFNSLSHTCRKEYADYVSQAKKEETRIRRSEKVGELLTSRKSQVTGNKKT